MNNSSKAVAVLATLVIVAVIGFAGYWLFRGSTTLVEALLPSVGAGVLFACATAVVCALILSRGLARSGRSEGAVERRKSRLYERILRGFGRAPDPSFEEELLVYASKAVLHRYLELRQADDPADPLCARAWHRLLMEIRKDLGHRDGMPFSVDVLDLIAEHGRDAPGDGGSGGEDGPAPSAGEFRVMSP